MRAVSTRPFASAICSRAYRGSEPSSIGSGSTLSSFTIERTASFAECSDTVADQPTSGASETDPVDAIAVRTARYAGCV